MCTKHRSIQHVANTLVHTLTYTTSQNTDRRQTQTEMASHDTTGDYKPPLAAPPKPPTYC